MSKDVSYSAHALVMHIPGRLVQYNIYGMVQYCTIPPDRLQLFSSWTRPDPHPHPKMRTIKAMNGETRVDEPSVDMMGKRVFFLVQTHYTTPLSPPCSRHTVARRDLHKQVLKEQVSDPEI